MVAISDVSFDYEYKPLKDLQVRTKTDEKSGKRTVNAILVDDEPMQPTARFWNSLFSMFGFNKSFFSYFDYDEVFNRISEVRSSDRLRLCVEKMDGKKNLLSVSNPKKPVVGFDSLVGLLDRCGVDPDDLTYANGKVESMHTPRNNGGSFDILGDAFQNRFVMDSPIDGYGTPNFYLAMIRMICVNGLVAMSRAFRSSMTLGRNDDNIEFAMTRNLDQFNNDEGFEALRNRIESAGESWASVREAQELYKYLVRLHHGTGGSSIARHGSDGAELESTPYIRSLLMEKHAAESPLGEDKDVVGSPVIRAFHNMTGDVSRLYGLANMDALSKKRQRTLPVNCKVYDLVNFATEAATHHANVGGNRSLQGWVGRIISGEYDLEGTADQFEEFSDFHIGASLGSGLTGSENELSLN